MGKDNSHGVQAVAQIMRDYSDRYQQSDFPAGLKTHPDSDTVKKAVKRQSGCGQGAKFLLVSGGSVDMFARAMQCRVALQSEEGQESDRGEGHVGSPSVQRKDFRQYIEQRHGHHCPGAETEQEMQSIAKP